MTTKTMNNKDTEVPERIRLVKREGRFANEWYYHGEGREQVGCSASKLRLRHAALESASKQER